MFADLLALKVQLFHSVWPGADIIPIDSNMDTYFHYQVGNNIYYPVSSEDTVSFRS